MIPSSHRRKRARPAPEDVLLLTDTAKSENCPSDAKARAPAPSCREGSKAKEEWKKSAPPGSFRKSAGIKDRKGAARSTRKQYHRLYCILWVSTRPKSCFMPRKETVSRLRNRLFIKKRIIKSDISVSFVIVRIVQNRAQRADFFGGESVVFDVG